MPLSKARQRPSPGVTGEQVAVALGDVSPVDAAALAGDFADCLAESLHAAISTGIWGWFDDDLVFIRPWGVELDGIGVPVGHLAGRAGPDGARPRRVLAAHLPGARAASCGGGPPLDRAGHVGEIVDELLASAPRPSG